MKDGNRCGNVLFIITPTCSSPSNMLRRQSKSSRCSSFPNFRPLLDSLVSLPPHPLGALFKCWIELSHLIPMWFWSAILLWFQFKVIGSNLGTQRETMLRGSWCREPFGVSVVEPIRELPAQIHPWGPHEHKWGHREHCVDIRQGSLCAACFPTVLGFSLTLCVKVVGSGFGETCFQTFLPYEGWLLQCIPLAV